MIDPLQKLELASQTQRARGRVATLHLEDDDKSIAASYPRVRRALLRRVDATLDHVPHDFEHASAPCALIGARGTSAERRWREAPCLSLDDERRRLVGPHKLRASREALP